ncbi:hypothetical protein LIER_42280 [Lithospermum erythrorhizon]|uniref:Reverse transcriptase Ty1/copia-type domain-containing protein n=1 Tax=Lithospermum erythrorhizon TaxID=34254 RepID=A0AAV3RM22_LITER
MARVILHAMKIPSKLWAETINTGCHIHNRIIFKTRNSRSLTVYSKRTQVILESINVKVIYEDTPSDDEDQPDVRRTVTDNQADQTNTEHTVNPSVNASGIEPATRIQKNHPTDNIIGRLEEDMTTRKKDRVDYRKMIGLLEETCFISKEEPKDVKAALIDEHWINAMQEELVQFEKNDVWELVPRPDNYNVIGTKWIFMNKSDELGNVTRSKARLVAQGNTQIKGVDFEKTFVL